MNDRVHGGEAAELEAIRQLKYAYFRTLDLKQFEALGELLTEDATASYEDGKTVLEGRAAIVGWLASALRDPGIVTEHLGHHPEIIFTSDTVAEGSPLLPMTPSLRSGWISMRTMPSVVTYGRRSRSVPVLRN